MAERTSLGPAAMLVITNMDQKVVITPAMTLAECDELSVDVRM